MIPKYVLFGGFSVFLHNLDLLPYLFTFNFDKIICAYWEKKLKKAKEMFSSKKEFTDFTTFLKNINEEIIQEKNSSVEAYYIILYFIIRFRKPDIIVETGVERGASSLFLLQALEDNNKGKLYSIDLPNVSYISSSGRELQGNMQKKTTGICVPKSLHKRWKLILGDSKKELPILLNKISTVDVFVRDDEHTFESMIQEFEQVFPYLRPNGIIISDNVDTNNAFNLFSEKTNSKKIILCRDMHNNSKFGIIFKA
jgi:hypothetical protein